jgi:hypothetical protein
LSDRVANGVECYLCGNAIERHEAAVVIPHLALLLHLSSYEQDMAARQDAPAASDRRRTVAQALGAPRPTRRAG